MLGCGWLGFYVFWWGRLFNHWPTYTFFYPFTLMYIGIHNLPWHSLFPHLIVVLVLKWVHSRLIGIYGLMVLYHMYMSVLVWLSFKWLFSCTLEMFSSLALSLAHFWREKEEKGSWIFTVWLKSKIAGASTVSFTGTALCKLQAHSERHGVRNRDQMGPFTWNVARQRCTSCTLHTARGWSVTSVCTWSLSSESAVP